MTPTLLRKELITTFREYEMTEYEIMDIMMLLNTPTLQKAMCNWLDKHTSATIDEIILEAMHLHFGVINSFEGKR